MPGKITLITPPDIFENSNPGILFMHLADADQETVSRWLAEQKLNTDLNLYAYNGEADPSWILWALGACQYKYIDIDCVNDITQSLAGYILSKNSCCYKTADENKAALYGYINNNRVLTVTEFLERALIDQTG